jgi:hypothetical protein
VIVGGISIELNESYIKDFSQENKNGDHTKGDFNSEFFALPISTQPQPPYTGFA